MNKVETIFAVLYASSLAAIGFALIEQGDAKRKMYVIIGAIVVFVMTIIMQIYYMSKRD